MSCIKQVQCEASCCCVHILLLSPKAQCRLTTEALCLHLVVGVLCVLTSCTISAALLGSARCNSVAMSASH